MLLLGRCLILLGRCSTILVASDYASSDRPFRRGIANIVAADCAHRRTCRGTAYARAAACYGRRLRLGRDRRICGIVAALLDGPGIALCLIGLLLLWCLSFRWVDHLFWRGLLADRSG